MKKNKGSWGLAITIVLIIVVIGSCLNTNEKTNLSSNSYSSSSSTVILSKSNTSSYKASSTIVSSIPPISSSMLTSSASKVPDVSEADPPASPKVVQEAPKSTVVYITKTGKKYHRAGCKYLRQSCIEISLDEAKAEGYGPCSVCDPPQ